MPNLMQRGATWLGGKLKTAAGRPVTYHRGIHSSASITGTVTQKEYEELGDDGKTISVVLDDWVFTRTELIVNGEVITPRDGDLITETLNGEVITYKVLPDDDRRSSEWFDTSGILTLVHTKRVSG